MPSSPTSLAADRPYAPSTPRRRRTVRRRPVAPAPDDPRPSLGTRAPSPVPVRPTKVTPGRRKTDGRDGAARDRAMRGGAAPSDASATDGTATATTSATRAILAVMTSWRRGGSHTSRHAKPPARPLCSETPVLASARTQVARASFLHVQREAPTRRLGSQAPGSERRGRKQKRTAGRDTAATVSPVGSRRSPQAAATACTTPNTLSGSNFEIDPTRT